MAATLRGRSSWCPRRSPSDGRPRRSRPSCAESVAPGTSKRFHSAWSDVQVLLQRWAGMAVSAQPCSSPAPPSVCGSTSSPPTATTRQRRRSPSWGVDVGCRPRRRHVGDSLSVARPLIRTRQAAGGNHQCPSGGIVNGHRGHVGTFGTGDWGDAACRTAGKGWKGTLVGHDDRGKRHGIRDARRRRRARWIYRGRGDGSVGGVASSAEGRWCAAHRPGGDTDPHGEPS